MMNIKETIRLHGMWMRGELGGVRAILSGADLSGTDLSGTELRYAILRDAILRDAILRDADLSYADLSYADLRDADLSGADLRGADLRDADLSDVKVSCTTSFYPLQCPERGSYRAYKKASGLIVELEIPEDAQRSSATSRKCRASRAKVLSITEINGSPAADRVPSDYDKNFWYIVGETVEVENFETDRWIECAPGIHHFITREEAVHYA